VAHARFPEDRKGELTRQFATKVSDSNWHRTLSSTPDAGAEHVYWLTPFHHYQTNCPYLVGSYDEVADLLSRYLGLGYRTFILDIPPAEEELRHTNIAFEAPSDSSRDEAVAAGQGLGAGGTASGCDRRDDARRGAQLRAPGPGQ